MGFGTGLVLLVNGILIKTSPNSNCFCCSTPGGCKYFPQGGHQPRRPKLQLLVEYWEVLPRCSMCDDEKLKSNLGILCNPRQHTRISASTSATGKTSRSRGTESNLTLTNNLSWIASNNRILRYIKQDHRSE